MLEAVALYCAEFEVQRGVQAAFPMHSAVRNLHRQPLRMRRLITRYTYFTARLVREHVQLTALDVAHALQIAEIDRAGRPPGLISLLRHPIIILIFGTIAFSLNETIKAAPTAAAHWWRFVLVCWLVSFVLLFAGIAHMVRYLEPMEQ